MMEYIQQSTAPNSPFFEIGGDAIFYDGTVVALDDGGIPKLSAQIRSAAKAAGKFIARGKIVTQKQFDGRMKICKTCEFWDKAAFMGTGRCRKCGCNGKAKLKLSTEACPIGKWGECS